MNFIRTFAVLVAAFSAIPASAHETAVSGDLSNLPDASQLSANIVQVSGVVPGMGEHWADPKDLPLGPIYGVHEGKVIFLEFMIARDSLAEGKSYLELASKAGLDLPPVDQIDINWEPEGHHGYEVPHYDIHLSFVPHVAHEAIQPQ